MLLDFNKGKTKCSNRKKVLAVIDIFIVILLSIFFNNIYNF